MMTKQRLQVLVRRMMMMMIGSNSSSTTDAPMPRLPPPVTTYVATGQAPTTTTDHDTTSSSCCYWQRYLGRRRLPLVVVVGEPLISWLVGVWVCLRNCWMHCLLLFFFAVCFARMVQTRWHSIDLPFIVILGLSSHFDWYRSRVPVVDQRIGNKFSSFTPLLLSAKPAAAL
jgi:hypothetical protein